MYISSDIIEYLPFRLVWCIHIFPKCHQLNLIKGGMLFQLTTWSRDLRLSYTAVSEEDSLFQKTVAVIETSIWYQLFNGPQRKRVRASIDHQSPEFLFRWSVSEPVSAWLQAIHSDQNELVWAFTRRILSRRIGALLYCTDLTYAYT